MLTVGIIGADDSICRAERGAIVEPPQQIGNGYIRTGSGFCRRGGKVESFGFYSTGLFQGDLGIVFYIYFDLRDQADARRIAEAFDTILIGLAQ